MTGWVSDLDGSEALTVLTQSIKSVNPSLGQAREDVLGRPANSRFLEDSRDSIERKAGVASFAAAPLLGKGRDMGAPFSTPMRHLLFTGGGERPEGHPLAGGS
jgi:hypothetical protein